MGAPTIGVTALKNSLVMFRDTGFGKTSKMGSQNTTQSASGMVSSDTFVLFLSYLLCICLGSLKSPGLDFFTKDPTNLFWANFSGLMKICVLNIREHTLIVAS